LKTNGAHKNVAALDAVQRIPKDTSHRLYASALHLKKTQAQEAATGLRTI
jgi:hypothetical protein